MATPEVNCFNCIYFSADDEKGTDGECRRYPPTVLYDPDDGRTRMAFPYIDAPKETYCGEGTVPDGKNDA